MSTKFEFQIYETAVEEPSSRTVSSHLRQLLDAPTIKIHTFWGELKGAEAESFRPFVSPLLCGVGYFRGPVSSVEICSAGIKLLAQLVGA